MSERIVLRTGEALVEGAEDYLCAEPEVVIGELDGPVGHALANLIGDQVKGHTRFSRSSTATSRSGRRP